MIFLLIDKYTIDMAVIESFISYHSNLEWLPEKIAFLHFHQIWWKPEKIAFLDFHQIWSWSNLIKIKFDESLKKAYISLPWLLHSGYHCSFWNSLNLICCWWAPYDSSKYMLSSSLVRPVGESEKINCLVLGDLIMTLDPWGTSTDWSYHDSWPLRFCLAPKGLALIDLIRRNGYFYIQKLDLAPTKLKNHCLLGSGLIIAAALSVLARFRCRLLSLKK